VFDEEITRGNRSDLNISFQWEKERLLAFVDDEYNWTYRAADMGFRPSGRVEAVLC